MSRSKNPLAPRPPDGLVKCAGNDAATNKYSSMCSDASSAGNADRPRIPTFKPVARDTIPCKGGVHSVNLGAASFPRKVIWQALSGKTQLLPLAPMLNNHSCPYFFATERWADDETPVFLGSKFSNFFGLLIDLQKSMG